MFMPESTAGNPATHGQELFLVTRSYHIKGTVSAALTHPALQRQLEREPQQSARPHGSVTGTATLIVSTATLVSMAVTPANSTMAIGTSKQFTATGTFIDSSTQDVTSSALWSSSSASVATINNQGLASSVAIGSATITATLGTVSGSTGLTVANVHLVSIAITPANPTIAKGTSIKFTATGTFSDGSTSTKLSGLSWKSSKPNIAQVRSSGVAHGKKTGSVTIRASASGITGTNHPDHSAAAPWFQSRSALLIIGAVYWSLRGPTLNSLAVLPFVNASADMNLEYLSDGITDNIINSVSQVPNLKVISRTSTFRYKGQAIDPEVVGRDLRVGAVLTGRVGRQGDMLTITVELIDAADDTHIWGEQYQRAMASLFTIVEDITRQLPSRLRLKSSISAKQPGA